MDFERVVIKTLFYDMPIEAVAEKLKNHDNEGFLSDFLAVARKVNLAFTESELNLLQRDFVEAWSKIDNASLASLPIWSKCFKVLFRISDSLLSIDEDGCPIVHFNELLRWRMFTLVTGEDLLTATKVAKHCYEHHSQPDMFAWSDVLTHDEANINRILCKGMSDVHMHYGASLAIFHLSWISMMNDVANNTDLDSNMLYRYSQENQIQISFSSHSYSLRTLWIAAAFLRKEIFKMLFLPQASLEFENCWLLLEDDMVRASLLDDIQAEIKSLAETSLEDNSGEKIDYALRANVGRKDRESIHLLECGERELLFRFFLRYQEGNAAVWNYAGYFYLYLLIKNRIRQELEHTNLRHGFLNFKHYQDRKVSFIPQTGLVQQNYHNLVVGSSMHTENDKLELRFGGSRPWKLFNQSKFRRNLYSESLSSSFLHEHLSLVYSFGKLAKDKVITDGVNRFAGLRKDIKRQCKKIVKDLNLGLTVELTGVDASGNELECRPEVFAHAYRYMREMGIMGRTYHVGEDFYDIIDGLRAIDEATLFLELDKHCRLGHALALGVDPHRYYKSRRHNVVMPRQNLLDNYVWLHQQIQRNNISVPSSLLAELEDRASILYYQIGYKDFSVLKCWHAWLLRGEEEPDEDDVIWARTSQSTLAIIRKAGTDADAVGLKNLYCINGDLKKKGAEIVEDKLPEEIDAVIEKMQEVMIRKIAEAGISIETNPSSNLGIGPFEKYEDLPIFKLAPMEHDVHSAMVNVSVNTDDRGVFATSLYNEFSLLAAALFKQKDAQGNRLWSNEAIYRYIDTLRENGIHQRFKVKKK